MAISYPENGPEGYKAAVHFQPKALQNMLGLAEMVEENSGCYRHIQRIRSRNHRYGHPVIRSVRKLWSKSLSLPAQE